MKPFDPTKPVQTRDGRKARIICTDRNYQVGVHRWPIVAIIEGSSDDVMSYHENGLAHFSGTSGADLINIPAEFEFERWVNVYAKRVSSLWDTKAQCDHVASDDRIACVRVVIKGKEGDGL